MHEANNISYVLIFDWWILPFNLLKVRVDYFCDYFNLLTNISLVSCDKSSNYASCTLLPCKNGIIRPSFQSITRFFIHTLAALGRKWKTDATYVHGQQGVMCMLFIFHIHLSMLETMLHLSMVLQSLTTNCNNL